ncbi:hypothetical protein [Aquisphaera insulae]|uniref:hypothetical protein n=1 Tax=Aquisphaera insulae TaxID=2712864 RepID=UPI0013EA82C5|nr:hypothetical protein [Aquisphaera insulae]
MLDFCRWWSGRKTQIAAVFVLATVLVWTIFSLARSEMKYREVVREVREGFRREAAIRDATLRALRAVPPQVAAQSRKPAAP